MLAATLAAVYDAGQVRLAQIAQAYLARKDQGLPVSREIAQLGHLHAGLETMAQLPAGLDRDTVAGLLIETYGLLAVAQDPFLRPLLPPVPVLGATVRYRVRAVNGHATVANSLFIAAGATLAPAVTP